jgi:hypothetical protein
VLQGYSAIAGHGVAVLSPPMWLGAIATGQLVQPLPQVAMYRNSFWLVYPEAKRRMRKVGAFRTWLLAEVAASLGDDSYQALLPPSASEIAISADAPWAASPGGGELLPVQHLETIADRTDQLMDIRTQAAVVGAPVRAEEVITHLQILHLCVGIAGIRTMLQRTCRRQQIVGHR